MSSKIKRQDLYVPNNYDHVLSYLLGENNEKEKQQNMNTGLLQL